MSDKNIYLNGFTILYFNPENIHVSFNSEIYSLNNNLDNISESDYEEIEQQNKELEWEEMVTAAYWIVEEDGELKIKIIEDCSPINMELNNVRIGPLSSEVQAVYYLKNLQSQNLGS